MKIPFDIKFRPQIESGEYRVETNVGCPVRIVCWNMACELPILGLVLLNNEKAEEIAVGFTNEGSNFLGEPLYNKLFIITPEKELTEFEDGLRQVCEEAVKEAMVFPDRTSEDFAKTHSAELLELAMEELKKTFFLLQKDKYQSAFDLGKAEVMKDLPRWRKNKSFETRNLSMYVKDREYFVVKDGYSLSLTELIEKLPGFNE